MSNQDQETFQNDLEIEIIDLDSDSDRPQYNAAHTPAKSFSFSQLHFHRWSQLSPRQRLLRMTITLSLVVLAAIIILGNSTFLNPIGQYLSLNSTHKPAPAIQSGTDFFYIDQNPSWGQLFLDGKRISNPPIMGRDAPLHLARGRHQFLWRTEPFQPFHCTISVPVAFDDTCPNQIAQQNEFGPTHPNIVPHSWNLLFYESVSALPIVQRIALVQSMQAALNARQSTETVYPGERYLYTKANHAHKGTTTRPLLATLYFQFDTGRGSGFSCTGDLLTCSSLLQLTGDQCQLYCQSNQSVDQSHSWFLNVAINALWSYITFDGQAIAQYDPTTLPGSNLVSNTLPLIVTRQNGDWHTDVGLLGITNNGLGCLSIGDVINPALQNTLNQGFQLSFASGPVPAAGCLAAVTPQVDPATPSSPSSSPTAAFYLYRFGVLLAANDQAHHLSPALPLADIYERKLAQQLAQAIGPFAG
jgi:hypothetical protein